MIDVSKAKKPLTDQEEYAIRLFNERGFSGSLRRQGRKKTTVRLIRDGVELIIKIPRDDPTADIKDFVSLWDTVFTTTSLRKRLSPLEIGWHKKQYWCCVDCEHYQPGEKVCKEGRKTVYYRFSYRNHCEACEEEARRWQKEKQILPPLPLNFSVPPISSQSKTPP